MKAAPSLDQLAEAKYLRTGRRYRHLDDEELSGRFVDLALGPRAKPIDRLAIAMLAAEMRLRGLQYPVSEFRRRTAINDAQTELSAHVAAGGRVS
jgi:hypothetical protein